MAIARLHVTFIFICYLLQQAFVQGQILCSCSTGSPSTSLSNLIASDPRIGELISKAKTQKQLASQDCKCSSNGTPLSKITNFDKQSNKPQQNGIGIQEYISLRQQPQQALTVPLNSQSLTVDVHPPIEYQNVKQPQYLTQQQLLTLQQSANKNSQQSLNLKQPSGNLQPVNHPQSSNLQPVKESTLQPLNSQQVTLQQLKSIPNNDFQVLGRQTSVLSEIPLASLPAVNGAIQGLPSQISQGQLLSNLGVSSALPSIFPHIFSNPVADPVPQIIPQNDAASLCNIPLSTLDSTQNSNAISVFPSYITPGCTTNDLPQSNSECKPLNTQISIENPPNLILDLGQIPINSVKTQTTNQVVQVHQPINTQQPVQQSQVIQVAPATFQFTDEKLISKASTQSNPAQLSFLQSPPSQPVQIQPNPSVQNQPQSINSMLLSQLQSTFPQYPSNPSTYPSSHGSKSTMKALLPLLFNLLKEKNNGGCGCPPNCNCGCMNQFRHMPESQCMNPFMNYNCNNQNFNNNDHPNTGTQNEQENEDINESKSNPQLQVSDGYANQVKYGLPQEKDESQNFIESAEIDTPSPKIVSKKVQDKKKYNTKDYQYQNYKKKKDESLEYDDDYDDSYENED